MVKGKNWLVKLENNDIVVLTICTDGYVFNEQRKKLFVLKKQTMQMLYDLLDEYKDMKNDIINVKKVVKCNDNYNFSSCNIKFYDKLISLVFNEDNIKNPPDFLDDTITLIHQLKSEEKLEKVLTEEQIKYLVDELIPV